MMSDKPNVIRETGPEAIRLGKTLLRSARYGALAVIDQNTGAPLASRVGVAIDLDGTPLILISGLSAHTPALLADPRCSLLLGEPGKGDPLAHPRISLHCSARKLERGSPDAERARRRYLNRHPKAELYVGLGDFAFFALRVERASLNGGFGRAYLLDGPEIASPVVDGLDAMEQGAIDHMNADHSDAVQLYARHLAGLRGAKWEITGFDADGIDLADGDKTGRVWFETQLKSAPELRPILVALAKTARAATGTEL